MPSSFGSIAGDLLCVRPQFEATGDAAAIKLYLVKFVERVKEGMENGKATGVLHYDWVWTSDNKKFQCRELYDSPKGVCDHIDYMADLIPGLRALGVKLDGIEVTGSEEALADEALQQKFAGWADACVYFRSM